MSSVILFAFNTVELHVVTINEKPWTPAREVYRALEDGKATKVADIVKHLCSKENYAHTWQLTELVSETRKDDYYINEEDMYELVFGSLGQKTSESIVVM